MLIYNHKKEFLGIDEGDLKALGLSSLADLRAEAKDFADLFVKSPGFIHNFKHVHWIDYITCNDSGVDSKAIISVKGKSYTTNIEVRTFFLADSPTEKAYIIEFSGIRGISRAQEEKMIGSAAQKPAEKTKAIYDDLSPSIVKDVYEEEEEESHEVAPYFGKRLDTDLEIGEEKKEEIVAVPEVVEKKEEPKPVIKESLKKPIAPKVEHKEDETSPFANYVYDPAVASHDLGLPIDLVEEFIQDFIAQAESFKQDLYDSASSRSMDHLKIQSHKLKGVAANLRIEDALDALTIINTSDDDYEIKTNLDRLYRIIYKLANKEGVPAQPAVTTEKPKEVDDDLILSFKDESYTPTMKIKDSDVPASIDIAELADDDFLNQDEITNKYEDEAPNEELIVEDFQNQPEESVLHYDKKKIAHDIGLDIDSFNELFEDYVGETKELVKSMNDSIEKNDLYGCRSAAIKLKGMSENMRIHDFDSSLEAIINSKDISELKNFVKSVTSKLDLISKAEGK